MEKNQVLTRKLVSRGVFFLLLVAFIPFLSAQSRGVWKKSYDLKIGLGQGSRLLWSTTPTMRSTYTAQGLSDSFRSHDQWTNLMSYGISVNFSQSDKKLLGVGLSYSEWGFDRVKTGGMFAYQPHPDLEVYRHLVQGPAQELTYNFQQRYLTFDFQYMQRLDGLKLQLENVKLYFLGSFSPSLLISDALVLKTAGFALAEGKNVKVYDYYITPAPDDRPVVNRVVNPRINAFVGVGLRAEYIMAEGMTVLLQTRLQTALLPNHTGVQTASGVNAGVELGFIFR
jgi:hypothetical protein